MKYIKKPKPKYLIWVVIFGNILMTAFFIYFCYIFFMWFIKYILFFILRLITIGF